MLNTIVIVPKKLSNQELYPRNLEKWMDMDFLTDRMICSEDILKVNIYDEKYEVVFDIGDVIVRSATLYRSDEEVLMEVTYEDRVEACSPVGDSGS